MIEDSQSSRPICETMIQFFRDDEWGFCEVEGEPIIQMGFKGKNGNWTCYAHALDQYQRFIFLSVMESNVPEEKCQKVAEFLMRANYGLFLGNFEMDFSDGEVRYKTSIDVEDGQLTPRMIKMMAYTNVMAMDRHLPAIMSIIYAGTDPVEALAQVQENE